MSSHGQFVTGQLVAPSLCDGDVGSMVANHHYGGESLMVVTTLLTLYLSWLLCCIDTYFDLEDAAKSQRRK